ncbi:MAG: hypothetical protein IIC46_05115 [Planctomycetes bacterium]|nr:hypothetical protein [Planctomycetota bacterium]
MVFDADGEGPSPPALFVGGSIHHAGGIPINKIARLDDPVWSVVGEGTDNDIFAMAVFDDDGPGPNSPALFVGGTFSEAGGKNANHIAKWDGESWSPLGTGLNNDGVFSLAEFDSDGPGPDPPALIVGGNFTTAGGKPANGIAKWDGRSWSSLGSGVGGSIAIVVALTVFDDDGSGPGEPALFAGGTFTTAGGIVVNGIAKWNGVKWSSLGIGLGGGGAEGGADTLAVFDADGAGPDSPALYVGGGFDSAGSVDAFNIAKWDGAEWSALGAGTNQTVSALRVHDDDGAGPNPAMLYVGGAFTMVGGLNTKGIAVWSGDAWFPLGEGMAGSSWSVMTLATYDPDGPGGEPSLVYAGGSFRSADGLVVDGIAKWNGESWRPVGVGTNDTIVALTTYDEDDSGPIPPALFAGGFLDEAGGVVTHGIARFDGTEWSALADGVDGVVNALIAFDPDGPGGTAPVLVAGGAFISVGDDRTIKKIAMWDGVSWSPMGSGMTGGPPTSAVTSLAVWDRDGAGPDPPFLYAGGEFTFADGVLVNRIARWTGSTWAPLGSGMNDDVLSLAVYDPDGPGPIRSALYCGGTFTVAGGRQASRIARWDGSEWSEVAAGVIANLGEARVYALAEYDVDDDGPILPVLYVGGKFDFAGGSPAKYIARWNGKSWSAVGTGMNAWVLALGLFDADGFGSSPTKLYAGGLFTAAGGSSANHIASWDGASWSPLGSGLENNVLAFSVFDPDAMGPESSSLYVGGAFTAVGEMSSSHIAEWSVSVPSGDLDYDCVVGVSDLLILLGDWGPCGDCNDCPADLDGDCSVGVKDLLILLGNWG